MKSNITKLHPSKNYPKGSVYLVLDNIRSMHNVGAIFRTADAAGVKEIILCGITAKPPRSQITKTALNTIDSVPWKYYKSSVRAIKSLKNNHIRIVCLEQTPLSINFRDLKVDKNIAIVVGNEIDGVRKEVINLSDICIDIPMRGIARSLNVATATGIVLYSLI